MPDWSFRLRFELGERMKIESQETECVSSASDAPERVAPTGHELLVGVLGAFTGGPH
jgi:hypothetical protein